MQACQRYGAMRRADLSKIRRARRIQMAGLPVAAAVALVATLRHAPAALRIRPAAALRE